MLSIICENCKETISTGTGRWIANNGLVQFYCANCEGELFQKFVKDAKPKNAKPKPKKEAVNGAEVLAKV